MKIFFFTIFAIGLASQDFLQMSHSLQIPLKKVLYTSEEKQLQISFLMNYQSGLLASNLLESTNTRLKLKNFSNSQYVGRVGVGSPPQYLDVIFDTGSANFWVNSKLCKDLACETHTAYDNSLSDSYKKLGYTINVEFGTGEIKGEINYESVTIAGIQIPGQSFGEITDEIGEVFVQGKFSGILGLAFPKMAAFNFIPVFDNMMGQDSLEKNIFTFYYSDEDNSEIGFGGIDYSKFFGDIYWNKVIEEYYWVIEISDIRIGDKSLGLCKHGCKAAVDTGTSLLTAPPEHLNALLDELDLNCAEYEKIPDIVFVMNGVEHSIPASRFVIENMGECTVAVMPLRVPKP